MAQQPKIPDYAEEWVPPSYAAAETEEPKKKKRGAPTGILGPGGINPLWGLFASKALSNIEDESKFLNVDKPVEFSEIPWWRRALGAGIPPLGIFEGIMRAPGVGEAVLRRAPQLTGKEPGPLNPDPEQNPLLAKSVLPEMGPVSGFLPNFGKALYEGVIRPIASPLGILGLHPGLNPADIGFPEQLKLGKPGPRLLPKHSGPSNTGSDRTFIAGPAGIAENQPYLDDLGNVIPGEVAASRGPITISSPDSDIPPLHIPSPAPHPDAIEIPRPPTEIGLKAAPKVEAPVTKVDLSRVPPDIQNRMREIMNKPSGTATSKEVKELGNMVGKYKLSMEELDAIKRGQAQTIGKEVNLERVNRIRELLKKKNPTAAEKEEYHKLMREIGSQEELDLIREGMATGPHATDIPKGGTPVSGVVPSNVRTFPSGGSRQIYDIAEQIDRNIADENLVDDLLNKSEDIINRESDPEIIVDNLRQIEDYLNGAKISGDSDKIEIMGTIRDFALDKVRQSGLDPNYSSRAAVDPRVGVAEDMLFTPDELAPSSVPAPEISPVPNPYDPRIAPGGVVSDAPVPRSSIVPENQPAVLSAAGSRKPPGGGTTKLGQALESYDDRRNFLRRFSQVLSTTRMLRGKQDKMYSRERAQRFQRFGGVVAKGTTEEEVSRSLGVLKGPLRKLNFSPVREKFSQQEIDTLFEIVAKSPVVTQGERAHAIEGLMRLFGTHSENWVPQPNEINTLKRIIGQFGQDAAEEFEKGMRNFVPGANLKYWAGNVADFRKSIMSSMDLSAPFRQGLGLIHREEWRKSWVPMLKAFKSEESYQALMSSFRDPQNARYLDMAKTGGLALGTGEEPFGYSNAARMIPIIGQGVRASERAYSAFLEKLRFDTFKNLIDNAEQLDIAKRAMGMTDELIDPKHNDEFLKQLSNYINTATGRGELKKLAPAAEILSKMFFSPRLMSSRLNMMFNPKYMFHFSPSDFDASSPGAALIRKEKFKSLGAVMSIGSTMGALASMVPGVEWDWKNTDSADFMKIKYGNARVDPFGGFQQYAVLFNRLLYGTRASSVNPGERLVLASRYGYPSKEDVAIDFLRNKAAPEFGLLWRGLAQKDAQGRPIDWNKENMERMFPILLMDMYKLYNEDPQYLPFLIPSMVGMGVQVYGRERPTYRASDY